MDLDGLNQLISDVFGPNTQTKVINGWVSMRCPLAPWTHASGRDSRPSAGISIQPNNTSVFNCMTCHSKMPLHALVERYAEYTGEDLTDLIDELQDEAYLGPRALPSWESTKAPREVEQTELDKNIFLDLYDSAAGHPYLLDRGISDETAELLELKLDPADPEDGEERILFPVFGEGRQLYGFSGRATRKIPSDDKRTLKVRDYSGLKKAQNLLGIHLVHEHKSPYVLVVEGLFDYANAWQHGFPAVAVMHSTMTEQQARLLRNLGKPVYLFYDDDDAGQSGCEIAGKMLQHFVPVMRVRYPEIWIDDPQEDGGGHYVKDPGELIEIDFTEMIRDARLF